MDISHFDRCARALARGPSRRQALALLLGSGLAGGVLHSATAKKKRKHKKKLKKNAFGCVDVGKPCRGKDANCCSGICRGKKPKQSKQDKSRCVAHNADICQAGDDICAGSPVACGDPGMECWRTTGKASFCGDGDLGACVSCKKDKDCETLGFPPGSACVVCPGDCVATDNLACIPPFI